MFQMVWLASSTRIMGRPIISGVTIEIVVRAVPTAIIKSWPIALNPSKAERPRFPIKRGRYALDDLTIDFSKLPINQTSVYRMTNQPIVNIAFDKDLSAKLFPQGEFYGIVVCFM